MDIETLLLQMQQGQPEKKIRRSKSPRKKGSKKRNKSGFKQARRASAEARRRSSSKKRASPDLSATKFKVNKEMIGNDGKLWVVKTSKRGNKRIKRWARVKS